jgi:hypothetical protein
MGLDLSEDLRRQVLDWFAQIKCGQGHIGNAGAGESLLGLDNRAVPLAKSSLNAQSAQVVGWPTLLVLN